MGKRSQNRRRNKGKQQVSSDDESMPVMLDENSDVDTTTQEESPPKFPFSSPWRFNNGDYVSIEGLTRRSDLNGKAGWVTSVRSDGKAVVILNDEYTGTKSEQGVVVGLDFLARATLPRRGEPWGPGLIQKGSAGCSTSAPAGSSSSRLSSLLPPSGPTPPSSTMTPPFYGQDGVKVVPHFSVAQSKVLSGFFNFLIRTLDMMGAGYRPLEVNLFYDHMILDVEWDPKHPCTPLLPTGTVPGIKIPAGFHNVRLKLNWTRELWGQFSEQLGSFDVALFHESAVGMWLPVRGHDCYNILDHMEYARAVAVRPLTVFSTSLLPPQVDSMSLHRPINRVSINWKSGDHPTFLGLGKVANLKDPLFWDDSWIGGVQVMANERQFIPGVEESDHFRNLRSAFSRVETTSNDVSSTVDHDVWQ